MKRNISKVILAVAILALALLGCGAFSSLLGGSLLEDDFSNSNGSWGTGTDADSSVEYSNGGLQMLVFKPNYIVWSTPNDKDYENVHVEVTVTASGTDPTTAFGILCNEQGTTASYYNFLMTPAGEYAISKAVVGQTDLFLTNDDQWATSDLITQDAASYRISADCGNGALTLYVDGKEIASVSDSTYTTGRVGLLTWSGEEASSTDVTFDDFVVTKLGQ